MKNISPAQKFLTITFLSLATLSFQAHATPTINYGGYEYHDENDFISGDGLEWLRWDLTTGKSIDDVTNTPVTIDGGGWRVATNAEMASVYNNFFPKSGAGWTDSEAGFQQILSSDNKGSEDPNSAITNFFNIFGITGFASLDDTSEGNFEQSLAFFGNDINGNGKYKQALVQGDYIRNNTFTYENSYIRLYPDSYYTSSSSSGNTGIALVRNAAQSVPEPSVLALMSLGILGFSLSCRKRKKTETPKI